MTPMRYWETAGWSSRRNYLWPRYGDSPLTIAVPYQVCLPCCKPKRNEQTIAVPYQDYCNRLLGPDSKFTHLRICISESRTKHYSYQPCLQSLLLPHWNVLSSKVSSMMAIQTITTSSVTKQSSSSVPWDTGSTLKVPYPCRPAFLSSDKLRRSKALTILVPVALLPSWVTKQNIRKL